MKQTGTCPKCRSTTLLHIPEVAANTDTGTGERQPTFRLAVTGNGNGWEGCTGRLEAFACPRCGLVELYLAGPLRPDGVNIREVSVPAQGPHRT